MLLSWSVQNAPVRSLIWRAASIMLRVSAASIPPPELETIVSSAPSAAMWLRLSALNASDVTTLSG